MKKKQEIKKKLVLKKNTILRLTKDEMKKINGGIRADQAKYSFMDDCVTEHQTIYN